MPRHLIFIFIMASCPQAHGGQANIAYFAGGCFWCTEAVFQQAPGVISVTSGYMQNAETVQVAFDPSKTTYEKLLNLFWRAHNPTEVDRQGPDVGRQYRSAIFYVDEQQRAVAEKSKAQAQKSYSIMLGCAALAGQVTAQGPTQSAVTNDPQRDMIKALEASKPNSSLGEEARVFDPLVGTWDCDYSFHLDDGSTRHKRGEVLFGWVLDGRAVQDIWITYPAEGEKDRRIGTSVRFFDTALKQWRVVFVSPQVNYLITVQGGLEGDRIVLRGVDTDGSPIRWSFNNIKSDSFLWRGEKSYDGGKTWKLEEEHHMKRRTG